MKFQRFRPRSSHRPDSRRLRAGAGSKPGDVVAAEFIRIPTPPLHVSQATIGRAAASNGLVGAVEATIDAVRGLGAPFEPRAKWARALDDTADDDRVVVAVALENVDDEDEQVLQYGLAAGASPIDAAARSTLDALNRRLARVL